VNKLIASTAVPAAFAAGMMLTAPAGAQQALGDFSNDLIVSSATYADPGFAAGASTPGTANVGQYGIRQNGYAGDKTGNDNNFRGETIFNNTLYVTKGSGSNVIDTAYQVGTQGSLPAAGNVNASGVELPIILTGTLPRCDRGPYGGAELHSPNRTSPIKLRG
jgi:hypothetical protein